MNCPNCGAENEAGVRFCVECGTLLEDQFVDLPPEEDDSDRTILSSMPLISEEAKTVAVSQDDLTAAEAEAITSAEAESEPGEPEAEFAATEAVPIAPEDGLSKQRNKWLIAAVILILLCCCCATLVVVGVAMSDTMTEIMNELGLSLLPAYLPLV